MLRFTVAPFLWLLYSTPKVALAPLFILVLGLGSESKIALVFLLAVFPIILNTMEGAVTVSTSLVNAGRVYGVNGIALGWKVIFPATLPYSLAGIQRGRRSASPSRCSASSWVARADSVTCSSTRPTSSRWPRRSPW